jgi:hypothetical protein
MNKGHPFVGEVEASMMLLVDAKGRQRQLAAIACPHCRHALIIGIRGLQPLHMHSADALHLIEALRSGPAFSGLHASRIQPGRRSFVRLFRGTPASWYVAYDEGSDVCDFACSSRAPHDEPLDAGVSFTREQREAFAEACFA